MHVEVTKKGNMEKALEAFTRKLAIKLQAGLLAAGEVLLQEGDKLVPRDTEALVDSGKVRVLDVGLNTEISVGYGNPEIDEVRFSKRRNKFEHKRPHDYAVEVHEDPEAVHPQGEAQFLEKPRLGKQDLLVSALEAQVK